MSPEGGDWGRALTLVQSKLKVADAARHVVRVEARADGSQVWAVQGREGAAWFVYADGELKETFLSADERLPGAAACLAGEVLAWRPGRRAVKLDEDGGSVWKLFRKKKLARAVARHRRAQEGCADGRPWRVPNILNVDKKAARVQFERAGGEPLAVDAKLASTWKAVGSGLAHFQRSTSTSDLPIHDRQAELEILGQLHLRYARLLGGRIKSVDDVCRRLEGRCEIDPSTRLVAVHRDLHDGQFLVEKGRLWVLDFDQLCVGEAEVDPGNLTAHLVLRDLQRGRDEGHGAAPTCALALLSGYEPASTDATHDALRFYQAATYARLAILYSLRPRWRHLAPSLLLHAEASLDELGPS